MDSWGNQLAHFKQQVDGITTMVAFSTLALGAYAKTLDEKVHALVASGEVDKQASDDGKSATYSYSQEHSPFFERLRSVYTAVVLLPPSGIVSLLTEFDQLFGGLVRSVLTLKPEIWQSCDDSKLSYSEATTYPTMEALRESLLDRMVGAVLRSGGPDQFKWLESKLRMTLTKDLEEWKPYIELTERRNLLIHSDGCVTDQYLRTCQTAGVTWTSKPSIGDRLTITPEYFRDACTLILTLGAKLTHVLWRKVNPRDIETADLNLLEMIFDLVRTDAYTAAQRLGTFALNSLKKHPNEETTRMILVNTAQAFKWDEQPEKCRDLLDSQDWRASSDNFKLAVAVLRDDYVTAIKTMRQLGKGSETVPEEAYKTWPLFREARRREDFLATYAEIFGHPLKVKQSRLEQ